LKQTKTCDILTIQNVANWDSHLSIFDKSQQDTDTKPTEHGKFVLNLEFRQDNTSENVEIIKLTGYAKSHYCYWFCHQRNSEVSSSCNVRQLVKVFLVKVQGQLF